MVLPVPCRERCWANWRKRPRCRGSTRSMIFGPFSKYGLTSRQFPFTSTEPRFRKLTRSPPSILGKTTLASARHSFARS